MTALSSQENSEVRSRSSQSGLRALGTCVNRWFRTLLVCKSISDMRNVSNLSYSHICASTCEGRSLQATFTWFLAFLLTRQQAYSHAKAPHDTPKYTLIDDLTPLRQRARDISICKSNGVQVRIFCDRTGLTRYCIYSDGEKKTSKNGRQLKSLSRHHDITRLLK